MKALSLLKKKKEEKNAAKLPDPVVFKNKKAIERHDSYYHSIYRKNSFDGHFVNIFGCFRPSNGGSDLDVLTSQGKYRKCVCHQPFLGLF